MASVREQVLVPALAQVAEMVEAQRMAHEQVAELPAAVVPV